MSGTDPTALSATALARDIATGQRSAVSVMEAFLERIDAVNPRVNAIVSRVDRPTLLAEAREQDEILKQHGPIGPLHGLPMAVKDLEDVVGLPTTQGSPLFRDTVATSDSPMVARLRQAGAIFIGKTNVPEFGLGSHTYNPVFGTTLNAYDHSRTAGGSSGGAAVALATHMVPLADGSDHAGSLRNPAGFNNIYGFRPSFGRIPDDAADLFAASLGVTGPMARSVEDLALLFSVQAGPDPRMPLSIQESGQSVTQPLEAALKGRRVGWLGDLGGYLPMEDGILPLCEQGLSVLSGLGCAVEPVSIGFPMEELWEAWTLLRSWKVAASLGDVYQDPKRRTLLKTAAQWEVARGLNISGTAISRALAVRSRWFLHMASLFERYDHLVLPTAQVFPFAAELDWPKEIAGRAMDTYHRWMEVVILATNAQLPSLSVPVGFNDSGLPMGMQIIGRHQGELSCLQLGHAYDLATHWPARHPPAL
ncbi:amidase [Acidisoma silvae]|uniref:Amidase n=1 Tax=Acidisoma silvae TaxID=2802396 RepID=A0A963YPQ5_9PROT|nr:amidase [Acidisoma silvae]MCB8874491.1 amidase [Acidisoma silvae]